MRHSPIPWLRAWFSQALEKHHGWLSFFSTLMVHFSLVAHNILTSCENESHTAPHAVEENNHLLIPSLSLSPSLHLSLSRTHTLANQDYKFYLLSLIDTIKFQSRVPVPPSSLNSVQGSAKTPENCRVLHDKGQRGWLRKERMREQSEGSWRERERERVCVRERVRDRERDGKRYCGRCKNTGERIEDTLFIHDASIMISITR